MITVYLSQNKFVAEHLTANNQTHLDNAVWIDILNPSREEEKLVETKFKLEIPTKEEMREIELSSRLYQENDALFMTVIMVAKSDSEPKSDAVTIILINNKLITLRYVEPHSFALFTSHLAKLSHEKQDGTSLLIELLDTSIDRLADILENISHHLDECSQTIFHPISSQQTTNKIDYKSILQKIGTSGDLSTKVQESLISFNRLMTFFGEKCSLDHESNIKSKLLILAKDNQSLREHVNFLSNKVTFLLDATLGMVNIEQNNIIKIFSIAAVVLLPPTLVASIYGMNFEFMPELKWRFGYPFAIICMFIAAWLPYKYFKIKKWL